MAKRKETRLLVVVGCHGDDSHPSCPHLDQKRTEGAGCAIDYICKATGNTIDGYIEWPSEMRKPGDFPKTCPLKKNGAHS